MKIVWVLFIWILIVGLVHGQDPMKDIRKMNTVYHQAASYSMRVEMEIFTSEEGVQGSRKYEGEVKRSGKLYYSDLAGKTNLMNERFFLMIDQESQVIICQELMKDQSGIMSDPGNIFEDTTLLSGIKLKYVTGAPNKISIELRYENGLFDKVVLSINPVTSALEEVIYYYRKDEEEDISFSKVVIQFKDIRINEKILASVFSEEKFITERKGKLVPIAAFKNYRVIDQRKYVSNSIK